MSRKRRSKPVSSTVERLETRQLLTFSASLSGTTSTFTVGNTPDSVIFSQDGSGNLEHNTLTVPDGESFADDLDFDSTVVGSQHLAASSDSTVGVQGTDYDATIGTFSAPAGILMARFNLSGGAGSSATIDDSRRNGVGTNYTASPTAITTTEINVNLTGPSFGGGITLDTAIGVDFVTVLGNRSILTINNGFANQGDVVVGNAGSLAGLTQPLNIEGSDGFTFISVDDSADTSNTNATLVATGAGTASLTNLGPSAINFSTGRNTLSIQGGTGTDTQTIDLSAGNPLPATLNYSGGAGGNTLILQGTLPGSPSGSETYSFPGTGASGGGIQLTDPTGRLASVNFTGLKTIVDTTPVNSFNFSDSTAVQIGIGASALINGQPTTLINASTNDLPSTQLTYTNKRDVFIGTGSGNSLVSVTGSALLPGSTTTISGSGSLNTLNYDAGGSVVGLTSTLIPGEVSITRAGSGPLLVEGFQQIHLISGQLQAGPVIQPNPGAAVALNGFAGGPLTNVDVATITPADPFASSSFGVTIDWGDGTTSAGTVVPDASNPTLDYVEGSHTYTLPNPSGGYRVGVTVIEKDTDTTTFPGVTITQNGVGSGSNTANIAALSNTSPTTPITGATQDIAFAGTIATFTDHNLNAPASQFNAIIAWGDGLVTQGIINPDPTTPGQFLVGGTHTYVRSGTFSAVVTIQDTLAPVGSPITVARQFSPVIPSPLDLVGQLDPASDSGESNTDAITNVTRPNFFGTAAPGTIVTLFAIPVGTSTSIPIGSTVTSGSGAWSITSITLAHGRYTIQAMGTDGAGITKLLDVILPNPLQGQLVIDTVAPKVKAILFQPLKGDVLVTLQDDSSGLDQARVIDGVNYSFVRTAALPNQAHLKKGTVPLPSGFQVTRLSTAATGDPTSPQNVVVSLNDGDPIRGGYYRFTIVSGGIEDVAGNALDGDFYGDFPSGDNRPGGNFVAKLASIHDIVLPPKPTGSSASPLNSPGVKPTATSIPTVKSFIVRNGRPTLVLADPKLAAISKLQATKAKLIHGKATPHAPAKKVTKPHHG